MLWGQVQYNKEAHGLWVAADITPKSENNHRAKIISGVCEREPG
jgi:hypothetical protein